MKTKTFVIRWNFGMGDVRYAVRATSRRDAADRLELHLYDPDEEMGTGDGIKELPLTKAQRRASDAAWRKLRKSIKS
jgi:hypothetical protein